jgi:uncharacterized OB-fold protein
MLRRSSTGGAIRAMAETAVPFRVLPDLSESTREFWTAGASGKLCFQHCEACGVIQHPPSPICFQCHAKRLAWKPVSGRATVATFTVNYQPWMPGPPLPWIIAIVEIEEDPKVRLTTGLVKLAPEAVSIGMPVRVCFEHHADPDGDVWIPFFEPDPARAVQGGR